MLDAQTSTRVEPRKPTKRPRAEAAEFPAFFLHQMQPGEVLFSAGERKANFYRVESGSITISRQSPDGRTVPVETVRANAFFGLGYLETHIATAVAVDHCMVSCWPLSSLAFVLDQFPETRDRQHDAMEREFAHRRETLLAAAPVSAPAARLAAFLHVVSRLNAAEGRDATIVSETMRCPVVADYLKIDLDTLADALLELHREDLVAAEEGGRLRLLDLKKLERYGASVSPAGATSAHAQ